MKKIISLILVGLIGITIIPKTLVNEKHIVLESTTSVYTKEEVDSLLSAIRTNITNNTNELTNIKSELTALQNSLKDYALKTSLNTTNSNIDNLNTVVTNNALKIENLENLFEQGDATADDIAEGKTAVVKGQLIEGTKTETTTAIKLGTYTTSCSIDISNYYNGDLTKLTASNFIIEASSAGTSGAAMNNPANQGWAVNYRGDARFTSSKSYNSSTGKLTCNVTIYANTNYNTSNYWRNESSGNTSTVGVTFNVYLIV